MIIRNSLEIKFDSSTCMVSTAYKALMGKPKNERVTVLIMGEIFHVIESKVYYE